MSKKENVKVESTLSSSKDAVKAIVVMNGALLPEDYMSKGKPFEALSMKAQVINMHTDFVHDNRLYPCIDYYLVWVPQDGIYLPVNKEFFEKFFEL